MASHIQGRVIYGNQSEGRVDWNLRYIRGLLKNILGKVTSPGGVGKEGD